MEYVDGKSGLISELGNKIRWTVAYVGDGAYTIRSVEDPTLFIVPDDLIGRIVLEPLPDGNDIPDKYLWVISTAMGGGVKIQNVATGEYLYSSGDTNNLSATFPSTSSESYDKYVWRMANVNKYGNTSEYVYRELSAGFSVMNATTDVDEITNYTIISNPTNAIWANEEDFSYSTMDTSIITINGDTITGISPGIATVKATHKVTRLRTEFSVRVHPGTFEIYIFSSGFSGENLDSGSMLGHSWIQIVSFSSFEQTIGHYQLPAFGNVTIGRWGSQINESTDGNYEGIWYNREVYEFGVNGKYGSYVFSYETINKAKFNQLSSLIKSTYNGYKLLSNNCVHFAVDAWNLCVESDMKVSNAVITPDALADEIEDLYDSYSGNTHNLPATIICGFYNGSRYIEHRITDYLD